MGRGLLMENLVGLVEVVVDFLRLLCGDVEGVGGGAAEKRLLEVGSVGPLLVSGGVGNRSVPIPSP